MSFDPQYRIRGVPHPSSELGMMSNITQDYPQDYLDEGENVIMHLGIRFLPPVTVSMSDGTPGLTLPWDWQSETQVYNSDYPQEKIRAGVRWMENHQKKKSSLAAVTNRLVTYEHTVVAGEICYYPELTPETLGFINDYMDQLEETIFLGSHDTLTRRDPEFELHYLLAEQQRLIKSEEYEECALLKERISALQLRLGKN